MIHLVKQLLQDVDVHLASSSPRRKNILEHVNFQFSVTPSTFEENLDKSLFPHPSDYVIENSKQKALEVLQRLKASEEKKSKFVIGTDTVVVANGNILEKPPNHVAAYEMLKSLNDLKKHQVYSGVTLLKYDFGKELGVHHFYETTDVVFGDIADDIIQIYAQTDEPLDKAGGYGIQDAGGSLIERINGCYFNVQGFPLYKFCNETVKFLSR